MEYNGAVWESFYASADYKKILEHSCMGSGIGCVQALPAILQLKKEKLIPDDAVVTPGHAQDFTAGSHLQYGIKKSLKKK